MGNKKFARLPPSAAEVARLRRRASISIWLTLGSIGMTVAVAVQGHSRPAVLLASLSVVGIVFSVLHVDGYLQAELARMRLMGEMP